MPARGGGECKALAARLCQLQLMNQRAPNLPEIPFFASIINLAAVGNAEDAHRFRSVVNAVDYAIGSDANAPDGVETRGTSMIGICQGEMQIS